MVKRIKSIKRESLYFGASDNVEFIPSGCFPLDLVLGGGWAEGRIINVVGDKSTGKTLLAIEACANFIRKHSNGLIVYDDAEAVFDEDYAKRLGLPSRSVKFEESDTVEEFFTSLYKIADKGIKQSKPVFYVLDSMDSVSDTAEQKRSMDDPTYGTKAKQVSTLFRKSVRKLKQSNVTLFVISQIRDNIGVSFGRKHKRSGGKALDFYASQVLWLAQIKQLQKTVRGVKRPYGVEVKSKCEKSKVGLPFRDCILPIIYYYGVDEFQACLTWLKDNRYSEMAKARNYARNNEIVALTKIVKQHWNVIEKAFVPTKRKYE